MLVTRRVALASFALLSLLGAVLADVERACTTSSHGTFDGPGVQKLDLHNNLIPLEPGLGYFVVDVKDEICSRHVGFGSVVAGIITTACDANPPIVLLATRNTGIVVREGHLKNFGSVKTKIYCSLTL